MKGPVRKGIIGIVVAAAALWTAALVRFVAASPIQVTRLPAVSARPAAEHNLVAREYGPVVKASSVNLQWWHHAAFVVDGRPVPSRVESWQPQADDAAPWLELVWDRPRQVSSVAIDHEGGAMMARDYTLRCLPEGQPMFEVRGNRSRNATHALACPSATGLRLDFAPAPGQVVRLYEVKVRGQ